MTDLADLSWVAAPCALCGAPEGRELCIVERFSAPLRIVRCERCAHVRLDPRPADSDLPKLYDEDYYTGAGEYSYADDRAQSEAAALRAHARLERIEELARPGRLVEVGCSFGAFLSAAGERGWEVTGVDLSSTACAHLRERGIDVVMSTLEDAGLPEESADVVYLAETVEHLPDPAATLAAAARTLRPGGLAVLGTANHASLARVLRGRRWGYYLPGHLQYFTAKSLSALLRRCGFAVVRRRFGDDRALGAQRRARRAEGLPAGPQNVLADLLKRASCGGWSLGAGMVLYARRD